MPPVLLITLDFKKLFERVNNQRKKSRFLLFHSLKLINEIEVTQSCPTLCDPVDCSPPGSSVPGIFQARILEWIAISSSRDLSDPGIEPVSLTTSHALEGGFFTTVLSGKPQ